MKKIILSLFMTSCFLITDAQLLLNENFVYPAGTELVGAGGWIIDGSTTTNPISITTATPLVYSGYPSSEIGNELSITTGQDVTHTFTTQTTGTIYYSLLVNLSAAKATGDYFIHLATNANFGLVYAKLDASKVAFGIMNATGGTPSYSTSVYDLETTYLLVAKVDVATGTSSLIINPGNSATEPTTNWISSVTPANGGIGSTNTPTTSGIGKISIRQGAATSAPTLKLDGIHVATSWAALFATNEVTIPSTEILNVTIAGKTLTVTNSLSSTVGIFNTVGLKVQTVELTNNSADLSLAKGLYIVRIGNKSAKIRL